MPLSALTPSPSDDSSVSSFCFPSYTFLIDSLSSGLATSVSMASVFAVSFSWLYTSLTLT